jgi:hypothetical protein
MTKADTQNCRSDYSWFLPGQRLLRAPDLYLKHNNIEFCSQIQGKNLSAWGSTGCPKGNFRCWQGSGVLRDFP